MSGPSPTTACPHFIFSHNKLLIVFLILILFGQSKPALGERVTPTSLKEYSTKARLVSNPIILANLPPNEVYQVVTPEFIVQFFFSGDRILGFVLKRDPRFPIHVRWCFFRSCEESPYDYKAVVAESQVPPFKENSFQVSIPPRLNHHFQGMHWTSGMSSPVLP